MLNLFILLLERVGLIILLAYILMNIKMINDLVIFLFQLKNCSKYDKVS